MKEKMANKKSFLAMFNKNAGTHIDLQTSYTVPIISICRYVSQIGVLVCFSPGMT